MFIKKCERTYKNKKYVSWWIAESYREGSKIKCRYIRNITDLSLSQRENLKAVFKNHNAIVLPNTEKFFQKGYDYGQIVFFLYIMHKMGIIDVLSRKLSKKTLSLTFAVLLNRILNPSSKMSAIRWIKNTVFPLFSSLESKDYHENRVYDAMDESYNHLEEIMEAFYKLSQRKPLFLLYDITSVYFEGDKVKMSKRGYSRDKRPDRPQVLLGVVLNEKGFPVHFEIFEGNVKDETTVVGVIGKIKERFKLDKAIFVGDRGMVSVNNIEEITGSGFGYIVALTHGDAKKLLKEQGIQTEIFDKRIPVTIYQEGEDKKYVLCGSRYRKERDNKSLEVILQKGKQALEKVQNMIRTGRLKKYEKVIRRAEKKLTESGARKYYDFSYTQEEFKIIERQEEINKAKMLSGYYILQTSEVNMAAQEVEAHYKELQQVEQYFRDLKDLLDIRPIFHWVDRRVKTHIFLCMISQAVLRWVRNRLKEGGWFCKSKENTLEGFINSLGSIKLGKFNIGNKEFFQVQAENPMRDILRSVFDIQPFDFTRDRRVCSV